MGDTRTDSGQFYPGGKVIPRQPIRPGGGSDADAVHYYAETRTDAQKAQARQNMNAMSADTPIPDVLGKLPLRPLPPYLHFLFFDDTYPADAQAFYDSLGGARVMGGCSIVRKGGLVGGNFDYPYDDACSFAIKVSSGKGANADGSDRHASVGAAYLGTRLTENIVSSGVNTPLYRVLPGMTESGINDAGVYAKINVIPRDESKDPSQSATRNLHALAVVRYVLDHFDNAEDAATFVAAHYYIPEGSADSYHWMIADANGSYVVEDGRTARAEDSGYDPWLFNFRTLTDGEVHAEFEPEVGWESDQYGSGWSRRSVLRLQVAGGSVDEQLSAIRYTNAYADGWPWPDEFSGQTDAQGKIPHGYNDRLKAWAEAHVAPLLDADRKPAARGNGCWQTVHSAIYNFEKKTMAICVQEDFSKRYVFAADQANVEMADEVTKDSANGVKSSGIWSAIWGTLAALPTGFSSLYDWCAEQLAALSSFVSGLESSKRDKTDLSVYAWTGDSIPADADGQPYWSESEGYWIWNRVGTMLVYITRDDPGNLPTNTSRTFSDPDGQLAPFTAHLGEVSKLAHTSATSGIAKFGADGKLVSAKKSSTSADPANADYRDPQDNTCHKTEFTEWTFSGSDYDPSKTYTLTYDSLMAHEWTLQDSSGNIYWTTGAYNYVRLTEFEVPPFGPSVDIVATRSAVCTDGKKFVTDDVVDGKVSAAVSTNNPAFVSAVRNTPTENMPEDMPTDWGTYGTVGAALAALAAFVKWAKAKIVSVIGDDGKPTDQFATDLLGKPVAISAMHYDKYLVLTEGADAWKLHDRAENRLVFTASTTHTFDFTANAPTAITGKCRDFLLDIVTDAAVDFTTTGATIKGDSLDIAGQGEYLIAVTERYDGSWYVRNIEMKDPQ